MIDKLHNQLSKISGQQTSKTTDSKAENSELREVAQEMEAVFAYQLIKEMRKTADSMLSQDGLGSDTYTSLFDIEISKIFAERGLGLQDSLMRWLERAPNTVDINNIDGTDDGNTPEPEVSEIPGLLK